MSCHTRMLQTLQGQGMRLTAQRALILEDLFHVPGHRTAEKIYESVNERLPGLNRATVYRTLDMFRDAHILAAFDGPEGVTEFELVRTEGDLHHHLVCRNCGAQFDLEIAPVERLKAEIRERFGFEADLSHMVITGLCAQCRQEQQSSRSTDRPSAQLSK